LRNTSFSLVCQPGRNATASQIAGGDISYLAVVEAVVHHRPYASVKNQSRIQKIKATNK